jgi:tRNA(His) guanylyltransferase
MRDDLGDRMKSYEAVETERRLNTHLPIYARLDGRCFSKLTKDLEKPVDESFYAAMIMTTCELVRITDARIGYVQSDEISLIWEAQGEQSSIMFDGRVMKMSTVLAGMCSSLFMSFLPTYSLGELCKKNPHFDCRVLQLPTRTEAVNMLIWRQQDARRNYIQSYAQQLFSHKELLGKNITEQIRMIEEREEREFFDDMNMLDIDGNFFWKETIQRKLTAKELIKIPEEQRELVSGNVYKRSYVTNAELPLLTDIKNREGVIFDREDIIFKDEAKIYDE